MISHNPDINCTNARLYYYDFLYTETREGIPEGALEHIKQCRNCQTEMDRLKDLLIKVQERDECEQSCKDSAISTLLRLHFEYIGEQVKCDAVKPFLGSLADPVLQIRIPTPITTHINKCKACREDLQKLLDLHLPHKYLCRLGQILADKPAEDEFSCSQAQIAIPAVVSLDFQETNAGILKHLCICPDCRKRLHLHRESVRKKLLLNRASQNGFPCDSISAADIYDYCMPYGIDPADDEYFDLRESLTSHLRSCPKCLAKMQQLHRTITDIVERAESGVITIYNIDESESQTDMPKRSEMTGSEENLPIEQTKIINLAAQMKEKAPTLNLKPLLKIGIAAAVIVIGLTLLFNTPAAKAVSLEQIYSAIMNARNVYIAKFSPGITKPDQERWVSRSLNIYLTKTGERSVLLDLANKIKKETGSAEISPLSTTMVTETKDMMAGVLGLVPFDDMSLLPNDVEWNYVGNKDSGNITETTEKYELTWLEKTGASHTTFNKWVFFVDSKTNRPLRTEFYRKLKSNTKYTLESVIKVQYSSDDEIRSKIKEVFP